MAEIITEMRINQNAADAMDAAIAEWQAVLAADPGHKSALLYLRMVADEHGPKPGSALA